MRLFVSVFLIVLLLACPANACPDKPEGEYAFPARLEPKYAHGTAYFARFKSLLGKECVDGHRLHFYAIYEYQTTNGNPNGDMFVAAVTYFDGKPQTTAGFYNGYYNIYIGLPEADERNVPAGEFRNFEYNCCPPECEVQGVIACVTDKFSRKFPFDIIGNLPESRITCPKVNFFGSEFDLCFIYEAMRLMKYPIAAALAIKLFMYL
jgi:hypothetical protein